MIRKLMELLGSLMLLSNQIHFSYQLDRKVLYRVITSTEDIHIYIHISATLSHNHLTLETRTVVRGLLIHRFR